VRSVTVDGIVLTPVAYRVGKLDITRPSTRSGSRCAPA
jgi:hypothetical protein